MRNKVPAVFALALLVPLCQTATAQTAYNANDIIQHFAPQSGLGATRGLCIGTEAECKSAPAKPVVEPFDLVVTFDYNSDVLTREARRNLDEFAKALADQRLATATFLVEGHTDATGSEAYNLGLSERRASSVVRYLTGKGIDVSRLTARGYGKMRPRTANPFDAANRRVETRLEIR
ncbi:MULTISPECIES: OmpA family protein [Chelatococcus]|uniref:Outer membrane protein OmpA-like peptidoglycan-associated protein n=1 Tax=Chelatococcus caeni TaxID=1348468 RepID=A0A840CAJ0_9HYPH|nr:MULTISPECIES: OmpA family protein [Chelatococcus]ALA16814.1 flagellar motor protein MotB [Chelatococcus sp. CO-6]MBB4019876.1 outer membrane protein OmpA-like peptidoglycan-associated protein [Chelatococcus caeni]